MGGLISAKYQRQLRLVHANKSIAFGGGGYQYVREVEILINQYHVQKTLDYGCGTGTLKRAIGVRHRVLEYDPCIVGKEIPPMNPVDLVVCTDVLEHIEPEYLNAVVEHIYSLTRKVCFMAIATRPAKMVLNDGRNAHLTIADDKFWLHLLGHWNWQCKIKWSRPDFDLVVVLSK